MKNIFAVLILASGVQAQAQNSFFTKLEQKCVSLGAQVKAGQVTAEEVLKESKKIFTLGQETMRRYGEAFPACQAQFDAILEARDSIFDMPLKQIKDVYHNALTLPEAPEHCYFGRSFVAHAAMAVVKAKEGLTPGNIAMIEHYYEELAEHATEVAKRIEAVTAGTCQ